MESRNESSRAKIGRALVAAASAFVPAIGGTAATEYGVNYNQDAAEHWEAITVFAFVYVICALGFYRGFGALQSALCSNSRDYHRVNTSDVEAPTSVTSSPVTSAAIDITPIKRGTTGQNQAPTSTPMWAWQHLSSEAQEARRQENAKQLAEQAARVQGDDSEGLVFTKRPF